MAWISLPAGTAVSIRLRKRMNLVEIPRHALSDDGAVEDIERGAQRGDAMPDIIMGHRSGSALLNRETWLGAVECLNLRLLID